MYRSAMFALALVIAIGASLDDAGAASKKKGKRWVDFTPEERAQLMKEARKGCRKKYGAIIDRVVIDYHKQMIVCWRG